MSKSIAGASRAEAYRFKGEWDSAIDDYSEAIQLEPAIGKNYFHRGNCYFKKGDFEKALRDYNEAIVNDPCLAEAYYERGNLRRRMGDLEVAIADYDEAVLLNPNIAEIYYNRGKTYQLKGDLNQAIIDYSESIRLKPKISPGEKAGMRASVETNFLHATNLKHARVCFHWRRGCYGWRVEFILIKHVRKGFSLNLVLVAPIHELSEVKIRRMMLF